MSSLIKSTRFQEDCEKYRTAIASMPEGAAKQESQQLLNKLIAEIKKLDSMHMEMIYTRQMPSMGTDMKQGILSLRKKLDSKLKSLNQ
jgi:molecular chaperone GrpE (heat shock protein)